MLSRVVQLAKKDFGLVFGSFLQKNLPFSVQFCFYIIDFGLCIFGSVFLHVVLFDINALYFL